MQGTQTGAIDSAKSLAEALQNYLNLDQRNPVFSQAVTGDGSYHWESCSKQQLLKDVSRLAHYLQSVGVHPSDKVAILSFTRPEWLLADFSIHFTAAVSVSIYHSLNTEETGFILGDSEAKVVFAENQEQVDKLLKINNAEFPTANEELGTEGTTKVELKQIIAFEKCAEHPLVVQLDTVLADQNLSQQPPDSYRKLNRESMASLVYTSGTTGRPKGVIQTHGNHLANVSQALDSGLFRVDGNLFLLLPLAHSFARLVGYLGFLTPCELKFPAVADKTRSILNAEAVFRDIRAGEAEVVPVVPRLLEKIAEKVEAGTRGQDLKSKLLSITLSVANKRYDLLSAGLKPSLLTELVFALTGFVRRKIKTQIFGVGFSHGVSGGAKLPKHVSRFFLALQIPVYEGYGLTETCVATNVNRIGANRVGSVGPAFRGVEVKIADDGEILFRGPNVAKGYYKRPLSTQAAWDKDGWFHTGDLGRLDQDGYLFITGRKKEIIVLSNGKKVVPAPIEERLKASPLVSQALVFGDGRSFCVAVVSASASEVTHEEVNNLITEMNRSLNRFETVKRFHLVHEEWTVENGLLTPTLKVRRGAVFERYKEYIEALY